MLTPTDTETPAQIDALRNFAAAAELAMLENLAGTAAVASQLRGLHNFADANELAVLEKLAGAAAASQLRGLHNFADANELAVLEKLAGAAAASQLRGLHNFAGRPDLAELARMLDSARQGLARGLEQLAASPDLAELERILEEAKSKSAEPDLLAIIRVQGDENVHSNFLAWLLNPTANHGFGDYFLKKFLLDAVAQSDVARDTIAAADWSQTIVRREWYALVDGAPGYLDILVVNWSAQILCAIENKVFSPESVGQLSHYRKALENDYPDFDRNFVFLSPDGRFSQEDTEQGVWTPADYIAVHNLVKQTVADNDGKVSETVRVILEQYAVTLRRNIVPELNESAELQQLARKIYLEHREAIALIYRHQPDWVPETMQILKEAVAEQKGWHLDKEANGFVRFRSDVWDGFSTTRTGTGWAPSPALLLFEFKFSGGRPYLELMLGPGTDEKIREKLFESARQNPAAFRRTTNSLVSGFTRLHGEADYILDDSDYGVGWDDGPTHAKIKKWVVSFAQTKFPAMNEVIINCLREYEAGQSLPQGQ